MIGILSAGQQVGGAELLTLHLTNWLRAHGEDSWLFVGSGGEDQISPMVSECEIQPIGVKDLEWACARSSGVYVYGSKLIGQNRNLAKRVNNAPIIVSYFGGHNPDYCDTRDLRVDQFLFESENLAIYARKYLKIPYEKMFRAWVPIVVPEDVEPIRLFPDRFTFGVVGRLVESKQVLQVLQAFRLMDNEDTALVIVGDGWSGDRKMLQHTASWTDRIAFTGLVTNRTEMFGLLKGFDCLVSASRHEGIPTVMREAMLLGVPVIATEGLYFASDGSRWPGGAQELIAVTGGTLVELNNMAKLVEAMNWVIGQRDLLNGEIDDARQAILRKNEEDGQRLLALLKGESNA